MDDCEHLWVRYDRSDAPTPSGKAIFVVHEFLCQMCGTTAMIVDTVRAADKPL